MRKPALWTVAVGTVAGLTVGVTSLRAQAADSAGELRALDRRWVVDAYRDKLPDVLQRVMGDDFVMTYVDGNLYAKAREVATVTAEQGRPVAMDWDTDSVDVRLYGDAAVVRGLFLMKRGGEVARRLRYTNTYVRRGGAWQVVASQFTNAPLAPRQGPSAP